MPAERSIQIRARSLGRPGRHGRRAVADHTCRCHLPLDPPAEPHWWPSRDPEPDPDVRIVALHGETPTLLRDVRVTEGWHTEGVAATHPDATPPRPWPRIGRCWDGVEHPVVDVTARVPAPPRQPRQVGQTR